MSTEQKNGAMFWILNLLVLTMLAVLSWNANKVCADVDTQGAEIAKLKQESVRWQIMAEDVKEIKGDLKRLLQRRD